MEAHKCTFSQFELKTSQSALRPKKEHKNPQTNNNGRWERTQERTKSSLKLCATWFFDFSWFSDSMILSKYKYSNNVINIFLLNTILR